METAGTRKRKAFLMPLNGSTGHSEGGDKLEEVLHWCDELGVKIVSIWDLFAR